MLDKLRLDIIALGDSIGFCNNKIDYLTSLFSEKNAKIKSHQVEKDALKTRYAAL